MAGTLEAGAPRAVTLTSVFQPIASLSTGNVVGYEALARSAGSSRGARALFTRARAAGAGPGLEARAIRTALESAPSPPGVFLALNVSPSGLASAAVRRALPEDLTGIVLEITENEPATEPRLLRLLEPLRERGARIAVDDAGAGYAGLSQVLSLSPDIVKLDRKLVDGVADDPAKIALVDAMVRFTRATGAEVCAEGVERLEDLRVLCELDVTSAQGFILGKPAPVREPVRGAASVAILQNLSDALGRGVPVVDPAHVPEQLWERLSCQLAAGDLASAIEPLRLLLRADEIAVWRFDYDAGHMHALTQHEWAPDEGFPLDEHRFVRHLVSGRAAMQVHADDPDADPERVWGLQQVGFRSALLLPLLRGSHAVGLLSVLSRSGRAWGRRELVWGRAASHQLAALVSG